MRKLLMDHLKSNGESLWAARTRAAMDVWLGWLAVVLNLDKKENFTCSFSITYGRLLLTRRWLQTQTEPKDLVAKSGESPGFFIIVTGDTGAHCYVTPWSYLCIHYHKSRNELFQQAFVMEEVHVPPWYVFIGHRYVQHAEGEWSNRHCVRYHTYLVLQNRNLPYSIAFAYGYLIASSSGAEPLAVEGRGSNEEVRVG